MSKRRYRKAPPKTGRRENGVWKSDSQLGYEHARADYTRDEEGKLPILPLSWSARSRTYWAGVNSFRRANYLEPRHMPTVAKPTRDAELITSQTRQLEELARACGFDPDLYKRLGGSMTRGRLRDLLVRQSRIGAMKGAHS